MWKYKQCVEYRDIIENRERIRKRYPRMRSKLPTEHQLAVMANVIGRACEHVEAFNCQLGFLVIISPYGEYSILQSYGFRLTDPVYHPDAKSYVRLFRSRCDFVEWLRSIK